MNPGRLALVGVAIIFVGFLVVAVGELVGTGASGSSGGFILIGPIPIAFGSGPYSGTLASVALAVSVLVIVSYVVSFLFWVRRRQEAKTESE
jgi:uncharacterized membrane protein